MYAKTINLLCEGNKVFVKYQDQGEVNPTPPLRTPLATQNLRLGRMRPTGRGLDTAALNL